jgi:hypothetical protein
VSTNDVRSTEATRHGAYACLSVPPGARQRAAGAAVHALADRLSLRSEFDYGAGHPPDATAFLRRAGAAPADIADDALERADAIIHVASAAARAAQFCAELALLPGPQVTVRVLDGVVRPASYTGNAMHNFAYARRVIQQPGPVMREAFLAPMRKTASWWDKDWMERHTYFLPRYDDTGRMLSQGRARAAATGISCLLRRTYWNTAEPAPAGTYDFLSYFECAGNDIPRFREVCAALRDVARNPERAFAGEGPTWHGTPVATWPALYQ